MSTLKFLETLYKCKNFSIGIIGDSMMDHYIYGDVSRISPEGPHPIVKIENDKWALGGAANVWANVVAMGAIGYLYTPQPFGSGFVHHDCVFSSDVLNRIVTTNELPEIEKTRICDINGNTILRFDKETVKTPSGRSYLESLMENYSTFDSIIIADYAKGTIDQTVIERLLSRKTRVT